MLLLISYDLSKPGRDYSTLHQAIQRVGTWWHCLESVWIVETNRQAIDVRDEIKKYIDANDKLVVLRVGGGWGTYNLDNDCNRWLETRM
ncbi:CRISPR-associated endonuclease Cas2 [Desulfovibrio desulfuricans]|uniref:CRISPR-associated endonuclease Cas2 n=1 Tax=Desulfovibrio desulfuricans TaxID=876 RepID=UPI001C018CA1|nr:CRISPR-associated endonuclease Cas2 [Desulfovibrio desulfuricans]MBT9748591.1 SinR family protein [Desulfovibrio desulfuricans]